MSFFTEIPIKKILKPITYSSNILSLGSCFAVHMAEKLSYYKFENTVNPFGILFHPIALEHIINDAIDNKTYTEKDVFCHKDIWSSFDAHSEWNQLKKETLIQVLQNQSNILKTSLQSGTHLLITLGTAWVYEHKTNNKTVANCHKLPQQLFEKKLLSTEQIFESLNRITEKIATVNPDIQILYTISPVRHIKDGFIENQQSKAHLITALHQHLKKHNNHYYFPSYEIMMDELRDYRFYNADMIHPNQIAIDHIWEKFTSTCLHEEVMTTMKKVNEIQKMKSHRTFFKKSEEHTKFLERLAQKLKALQSEYPFMTFE